MTHFDNLKKRFFDQGKWMRILYILFFGIILPGIHLVLAALTIVQIVLTLVSDKPNRNLQNFGGSLARYYQQLVAFQLFSSDDKPFPFGDWPALEEQTSYRSEPIVTEKTTGKATAAEKKRTSASTAGGTAKRTTRKSVSRKAAKPKSPAAKPKSPATEPKSPATEPKSPATEPKSPATEPVTEITTNEDAS